eukprot:gene23875-9445_t
MEVDAAIVVQLFVFLWTRAAGSDITNRPLYYCTGHLSAVFSPSGFSPSLSSGRRQPLPCDGSYASHEDLPHAHSGCIQDTWDFFQEDELVMDDRGASKDTSFDLSQKEVFSKASRGGSNISESHFYFPAPSDSHFHYPAPSDSHCNYPAPSNSLCNFPALSDSLCNFPAPSDSLCNFPAPSNSLCNFPALSDSLCNFLAPSNLLCNFPAPSDSLCNFPAPSDSLCNFRAPCTNLPNLHLNLSDSSKPWRQGSKSALSNWPWPLQLKIDAAAFTEQLNLSVKLSEPPQEVIPTRRAKSGLGRVSPRSKKIHTLGNHEHADMRAVKRVACDSKHI